VIDVGLKASDRRKFHDALKHSHDIRSRVEVLDRDEQIVSTLDDIVLPGSTVDIDASQRPDRVLQLQLADVDRGFHFAPSSAARSSMFADNFLRVSRLHWVAELDRWIDVDLFTGPVTAVARDGETISVTAVGKESLALDPAFAWKPQHYHRRSLVTDVIRSILREQGEHRFDLPRLDAKTRHPVSLGRQSEPWRVCRRLADSVDRQLFYDGHGRVRLRVLPDAVAWDFRSGKDGTVTSPPALTFDTTELRNTIEVLGPEPESKKENRMRYVAMPPKGNALSPWTLARNGQPRFLVERVELSHARDMEVLRRKGDRTLSDRLSAVFDVQFEALPMPTLEPGDKVALVDDGERYVFRIRSMSIPLGAEPMSIGFHRRPNHRPKGRH
jgi:hypothetical protein